MKKILSLFIIIVFTCSSQELTTESIVFDGNNREFILYIPQSYSESTPAPILFAFHGGSGYADDFMNYEADFRSISDTAGFILIYPQALEDPNDDNSTNWLHKEPTDHKDIFFVEELVNVISNKYNIDLGRIYACGYSLGGMFSYELACQLNHKITGVASVAGAAFLGAFGSCELSHPTAILTINGTEDGTHPYDDQNGWYFPVSEINSYWSTYNNTDPDPIISQVEDISNSDGSTVERYSWINGDGCVQVEELKIINGGHDWPSPISYWGNQDINANLEIWNFLSKFNMDGLINCNVTNILEVENSNNKKLIGFFDLNGKKLNKKINSIAIKIFEDGSVEKKYYK